MRDRRYIFILLCAVVPCALMPADVVVCLRRAFAEPWIGPVVDCAVTEDEALESESCDCCRQKPARPETHTAEISSHGCHLCVHVPPNPCDPVAKDVGTKMRPAAVPVVWPIEDPIVLPIRVGRSFESTRLLRPCGHDPDRDRPLRI